MWSTGSVPDSTTADATIDTDVTIDAGEAYRAGAVAIEPYGSLRIAGNLDIASGLTVESGPIGGFLGLSGGSLTAGWIDIEPSLGVQGWGTVTTAGALVNHGVIYGGGGTLQTLTLASSSYAQSGELAAINGVVELALTSGASGFVNLAHGTLFGGVYAAENGGILELPGMITNIESASLILDEAVPTFGAPHIVDGGTRIEASLTEVGTGATLSLSDYDYITPNTLQVSGVVALDNHATLSPGSLDLRGDGSQVVGTGTILSDVHNDGEICAKLSSGIDNLLVLSGSVDGAGSLVVGNSAILELVQGSSEPVEFGVANPSVDLPGVLRIDAPGAYTGTIGGFGLVDVNGTAYGNAIDLPGFAPDTLSDVYQGTSTGGTLEISDSGGIAARLMFAGDYLGDTFQLSSDGHVGTYIALAELTNVPCFARGTRVATASGETVVEELRVSDRVITASGAARPVVWIGQRRVDCARHSRPELVRPVRVRAGAFGAGVPVRDLMLSPDHSIYAQGALIPVKYLLNGVTVVQEQAAEVEYFHIELDRHDIVLAEHLPTESYLDTGNRAQFTNGGALVHWQPDFSPLSWENACAPLATDGPAVLEVRRRLLGRIIELGYMRCDEPKLHILVDSCVIRPFEMKRTLHRFFLPAGTREVQLVSSVAVPAGFDLANTDCRTLGARIGAVFLNQEFLRLDGSNFGSGFHPVERNRAEIWRWTDGRARLILPWVAHAPPVLLELLVHEMMAGWGHLQRVSAFQQVA